MCWPQVQMKQTNMDFRGLITNRDIWTLLPILHDWLLSPERQPCPIEINRIFCRWLSWDKDFISNNPPPDFRHVI